MEYIITTDRLNLRQITENDFENLKSIISDEETMKYYPAPYDNQGVDKWIRWCRECYEKRGFGLWAVELKDGTFIGDCGITLQNIDGHDVFEIGYHINKNYWRCHYASEAAIACKKWYFENTDNDEVYSYMNIDNVGSICVALNNGMKFVEDYYRDNEHLVVYRITRTDYMNSNSK